MWMEEHQGKRSTRCGGPGPCPSAERDCHGLPYCLTMLEDGLKARGKDDSVKVYDIAELLKDRWLIEFILSRAVLGKERIPGANPPQKETCNFVRRVHHPRPA